MAIKRRSGGSHRSQPKAKTGTKSNKRSEPRYVTASCFFEHNPFRNRHGSDFRFCCHDPPLTDYLISLLRTTKKARLNATNNIEPNGTTSIMPPSLAPIDISLPFANDDEDDDDDEDSAVVVQNDKLALIDPPVYYSTYYYQPSSQGNHPLLFKTMPTLPPIGWLLTISLVIPSLYQVLWTVRHQSPILRYSYVRRILFSPTRPL